MAVPSQTALNPSAMADHLLAGGAAAMPTDTLPALVSAPRHAGQLWTLKQRPSEKPFILMAANTEDLLALAQPKAADAARSLAGLHWPGALTLVLPMRADGFPQALVRALNPGATTLGLRVPNSAQARHLLACTGPLATTSANPSGQPAALSPDEISTYFPGLPLLAPLNWDPPGGYASTVLAWDGAKGWRILRKGAVMPDGVG